MKRASGALLAVVMLSTAGGLRAQLSEEYLANSGTWEEFLKAASIVAQEQITGPGAVTNPWVLTLEKDGLRRQALWKDAFGERVAGFKETWKGEIAAYRLSRDLGLNMVPPTVEREFRGKPGSCQLWLESWNTLETIVKKKLTPPGIKAMFFARELCLQRAFDNLIYNVDRHRMNYLIMEDWRVVLIDHSRSFGTSKKAKTSLIYDEHYREGPQFVMAPLPRAFVEALRGLTAAAVRRSIGDFLTDDEIAATMARRDLIIAWLDRRAAADGETKVYY